MNAITIVMIVIVVIGILYLIADKLIFPLVRLQRNKKRAATWVLCHFFHPTGGFPQRKMCQPINDYYIQPPKEHMSFFKKNKDKNPSSEPLYCLIGTEVIGQDAQGKDVVRARRMTIRDMWPLEAPTELEKVPIETAYFVIGQEQALDPYNRFLPINTARATMTIREEKSMQYVANIMNKGLETLEKLDTFFRTAASRLTVTMIIAGVGALGSIIAAVIAFLAYRAAKGG